MVNLGIIGLGSAGRNQLRAAANVREARVIAVCDPGLRDAGRSELSPDLAFHRDWRRLLDDSNVNAVSVCVPHHLHAEISIAALECGKHLLLEKPIAATLADAQRVAEAGRKTRSTLMVEMTHRFYPPIVEARKLLDEGRLGTIIAIEDRIIEPDADRFPAWLLDRAAAGGGPAMTDGIHMLDRIAWLCGQRLRFHAGVIGKTQRLGDVEDTAAMQLSLEDGSPVHLLTAWTRGPGRLDDELTIYGTRGTLRVWAWRGWRFEPPGAPAEEHTSYPPNATHADRVVTGMTAAIAAFVDAVEGRVMCAVPVDQVLRAQEIIEQFYRQESVVATPASPRAING